ncbi:MAG: PaaI family thioesterase [Kofleriaceae bacterium]|nr:PaaI family thioesterase [Kofleriaceae bacterium]
MSKSPTPELPENIIETLNSTLGGFNTLIGLRFTSATFDELCAEVPVTPELHQPYGLVHGGIYSAMIETLASVGAAINAMARGQTTVGLENTTSFLKAVRTGTLYGKAVPLTRGRRTHVWDVTITDDEQRIVATGRVRMLCLEQGTAIGGEVVALGK